MATPEDEINQDCEQLADRLRRLRADPEVISVEAASIERTLLALRAGMAERRSGWSKPEEESDAE